MSERGKNRNKVKSTERRYFIEELVIRDVNYREIFKLHDKEFQTGMKMMENFFKDKLQEEFKFVTNGRRGK